MTTKAERHAFWKNNIKTIKKRITATKKDYNSDSSAYRREILGRILADDEMRLKTAIEFEKSLGPR